MSLRSYSLIAVFLAGLSGCAALTTSGPEANASGPAAETADAAESASEVEKLDGFDPSILPKIELSDELMMRFLVGDIAAQRGNSALAAQAWLDLAQRTQDPRAAQRATQLALSAGQLVVAQEAALLWVAGAPNSIQARQILVSLLIRSKRVDQVEPHLRVLLNAKPAEMAPFFMQMHQLWDKNSDRNAVVAVTDQLTAGFLTMPEARFARAVAYSNAADDAQALAELEQALSLRASWEPAVLYKAQLLSGKKDPALTKLLQDAAKANPMSTAITLAQARNMAEGQNYPAAQQQYEAVLNRDPQQIEALIGAGLIALELHDLERSQRYLEQAVALNSKIAPQLAVYLGQIAEQQHRERDAIQWYLQVPDAQAERVQARLPRLYARIGEQKTADAALAALPVASLSQQINKAQIEAQVWRERKNLTQAVAVMNAAIKRHPTAGELYYDRSLYLDLVGDIPAAEADLRYYLQLNPGHIHGLNALGYILANRTDRYAEADTYLSQAMDKEPNNPVVLDSMGWLRFKQGKLNEAAELLKRAYAQLPDPEIAAHYAEVLWQKGDKKQAMTVVNAAMLLEPDDESLLALRQKMGW
ncbi:tetratricopeptide repeat protein [Deefgea salmonis]|uniref:Tetratricopeptide repeat protein n=1 Tax=Deefgea salmonis TaxID=2875502 RepID=A0ABS8BJI0_9NEIS|nr:tetratricopeptide repeat protein [Deefgea salmonis]MCB5195885.1 tetratricopeptide repeat protein [Deefgea salmonis]